MNFTHFSVQKDDEGRRLDRLVRKFLCEEPLSRIHKSIRNGIIRINGLKKDAAYRVQKGDILDIADFLLQKTDGKPTASEKRSGESESVADTSSFFTDVFVNEDIRIINKAYGIPVQGGNKNIVSLDELIKAEYFASRRNKTGASLSFKPGPLHRIDRRTPGLVTFSQSLRGARLFSQALAEKRIKKEYLAVLQGKLTETLEAEHFIERAEDTAANRERQQTGGFKTVHVFGSDSTDTEKKPPLRAKKASSRIEPLAAGFIPEAGLDCTLARVIIETGRTHQIRSQSAFCGFPLLGDTAYGAAPFSYTEADITHKLFLHAFSLSFEKNNPLQIPCKISAQMPPFFQRFVQRVLAPSRHFNVYCKQ